MAEAWELARRQVLRTWQAEFRKQQGELKKLQAEQLVKILSKSSANVQWLGVASQKGLLALSAP